MSTLSRDGRGARVRAPDAALLATARDTIRRGSGSFAAAARLLPRPVRDDAVLLYAWCRHCDDVVDGQVLGHASPAARGPAAETRLAQLRARTLAALRGEPPAELPYVALEAVTARCAIDPWLPLEHLEGHAMDVSGAVYETLDDLLPYCARVAGVVGEMMAAAMGVRAPAVLARAGDLGIAFQLTNVARDVLDDARIGRVYLPRRWLDEAGVPGAPDAILAPEHRTGLAATAARLLDAAEPYYASARVGLRALPPRCAWAIGTALVAYRTIGLRVRALGPRAWDTRVATSGLGKLGFAASALPAALRASAGPPPDAVLADHGGLWRRGGGGAAAGGMPPPATPRPPAG